MAIQNVNWLGSNIAEDSTHRLVTDEQIEKWNRGGGYKLLDVDVLDFDVLEEGKYKYYLKFDEDGSISYHQFSRKTVDDIVSSIDTYNKTSYTVADILHFNIYDDYIIDINNYLELKELHALYIDVYGSGINSFINIRSGMLKEESSGYIECVGIDLLISPLTQSEYEQEIEGTVTIHSICRNVMDKNTNSIIVDSIQLSNGIVISDDGVNSDTIILQGRNGHMFLNISEPSEDDGFPFPVITTPIKIRNERLSIDDLNYIYPGMTCTFKIDINEATGKNDLVDAIITTLSPLFPNEYSNGDIYCKLENQDADDYYSCHFLQICTIISFVCDGNIIPLNGLYKFIRYGYVYPDSGYGYCDGKYNVNTDVTWSGDWKRITYTF